MSRVECWFMALCGFAGILLRGAEHPLVAGVLGVLTLAWLRAANTCAMHDEETL